VGGFESGRTDENQVSTDWGKLIAACQGYNKVYKGEQRKRYGRKASLQEGRKGGLKIETHIEKNKNEGKREMFKGEMASNGLSLPLRSLAGTVQTGYILKGSERDEVEHDVLLLGHCQNGEKKERTSPKLELSLHSAHKEERGGAGEGANALRNNQGGFQDRAEYGKEKEP